VRAQSWAAVQSCRDGCRGLAGTHHDSRNSIKQKTRIKIRISTAVHARSLGSSARWAGYLYLQVEDFSEFGKGTKSAGQGIEGGTPYRELSPRAGPAEIALPIGAISSLECHRIGILNTLKMR
jgi:hypothetical protein